jgi:excinuclease UvrABC nuclease subunit
MRARKQVREIPDTSGVYQIRCKSNGKIYVGSAVNPPESQGLDLEA